MIVSYLTDSYFEWGKLFLESFRLTNSGEESILFHTRDLNYNQIDELHNLYPRIWVENESLDMKALAIKYDVSKKDLVESREDVASGKLEGNHRLWMDVTSVFDRMDSLYKTVMSSDQDYIIHFDIDVLFRGNISWLIELAKENEVNLIIRGDRCDPKVAGGLFTLSALNGSAFLSEWYFCIRYMPEQLRIPLPFHQAACNRAYLKLRDYIKVGQIPYGEGNKVDAKLGKDADIWLFKTKRKLESLQMAKAELERLKCQECM